MALARKTVTPKRGRTQLRSIGELERNLQNEIEALEHRAHDCGLHVTARGLNRVKNALGWELAGQIEQAGNALNTN